jgi:hypothetical protein
VAAELWCDAGGILSLLDLCDQHGEALEADLIDHGVRLRDVGTEAFTWRDLYVLVRHAKRDSALMRAMHPDTYRWGLAEYMLADLIDTANWLMWAKTEDGRKNRRRPKRYPRPGMIQEGEKRVKGTAVPVSEIRERLRAVQGRAG